MADEKNPLGIRQTAHVELRIPRIPGADPEVLVAMAQEIIKEMAFWAPLAEPQKLADVAGAVLGDVPVLEQIRSKMAQAPSGHFIQAAIMRPSLLDPSSSEVELVLHAPVRLHEAAGDTSAMASFVTVVGLLTSPTARGLLMLDGRRVSFDGPFKPDDTDVS